jgi:hypothetical protein
LHICPISNLLIIYLLIYYGKRRIS